MGFGIALVPAGLGHFGVDEVYQACYFTQSALSMSCLDAERADRVADPSLRIRDFMTDLVSLLANHLTEHGHG
jgi:hypothetical protein